MRNSQSIPSDMVVRCEESSNRLTIIIACFNDFNAFRDTFSSLVFELLPGDEVVIIDSSYDGSVVLNIVNEFTKQFCVRYYWVKPSGVYSALNYGIERSSNTWIQILNSGDSLLCGGRNLLDQKLGHYPDIKIHVFAQQSGFHRAPINIVHPRMDEIWPHQSIIVNKSVHKEMGLYDESLKIVSDQLYFAEARKVYPYIIHDEVLTYYDLAGMSSKVTISLSRELFIMWRAFGKGVTDSIFRAYVSPRVRLILEFILGKQLAARFKRILKSKIYSNAFSR